MNELNVVVPIKNPRQAKERLAPLLSPQQREDLAWVLIEQTFQFFKAFTHQLHVLVVTDCERVAAKAADHDYAVLREAQAEGETAAVERATAWSVENGFRSQVVIPGDMVALSEADVHRLLACPRPNPSVIFCPATDDDGTNAILTTPPDILRFRFGARSFPGYCAQATAKNVPYTVLRLPSLVLDLDTPEDWQRMKQGPVSPALRQWMQEWDQPCQ